MNELPRELEAFLAGPPAEHPSAAFRERILEETEIFLPRPWISRRLAVPAAALCMVVIWGALTSWSILRRPGTPPQAVPAAVAVVEAPRFSEIASIPLSPAEMLEWQAIDSNSPSRPQLYWYAGQTYLADEGDYLSALRCYRQALDAGTPELREVTDDDDLLAMVLKFDRSHKEKKK